MKKVLIDSSIWVSFLAEDANSPRAYKLFNRLLNKKDGRKILVPRIIYLEVINTLLKLNIPDEKISLFKNMFKVKHKLQLA